MQQKLPIFATLLELVVVAIGPKVTLFNEKLLDYLRTSADGLRYFDPVALYTDDIQCTQGLLTVLRRVAQMEGVGDMESAKLGHYSYILCDVTIFWQLFRFLHAYRGLPYYRLNICLIFGPWHAYIWVSSYLRYIPAYFSCGCLSLPFPTRESFRTASQSTKRAFLHVITFILSRV